MCDKPNVFTALVEGSAPSPAEPRGIAVELSAGSRRRRLWELPSQALCPVIGVCLPMPLLRRRLDKLIGNAKASDYELHCSAINECGRRTTTAEALQKDLDQRYIRALREAARCKTTVALRGWWDEAHTGSNPAGSLWATLTHARCDDLLTEQVLRDIHMLQHQVGAANRADLERLEQLVDENAMLGRELARVQARSTRLLQERAMQVEQQAADIVKLRAELLGRDTLAATLADEIRALEAATPGLRSREVQAAQIRQQLSRIHELERALLNAQQRADREQARAEELQREPARSAATQDPAPAEDPTALPRLDERAVLCVGGRQAAVPVYRQLIERTGGRFLHHDGGEEDAVTKLDASLAAADLVICQTGCVSHDAYWRVKDHCKRHGKRCVFVDKPSASSLRRALSCINDAASAEADVPKA